MRLLSFNRPAAGDGHIVVHITDWVSSASGTRLAGYGSSHRQCDPAQSLSASTVAHNPERVNDQSDGPASRAHRMPGNEKSLPSTISAVLAATAPTMSVYPST